MAREDVCIGCDSSHTARHVPGGGGGGGTNNLQLLPYSVNSLVKFVNLFREDDIVQELVDVLSLSRKQDSVGSQYT